MKYSINTTEGDFEPGSNMKVLKNRLQINREEDMAEAEYALLLKLYQYIFEPEFSLATLDFELIKSWHRKWLKPIYDWAGELRTVNMSKDGFTFAAAPYLEAQVSTFERCYLERFSVLTEYHENELIECLADSHVEFILIHPFREGNGRLSRLLMDTMATKAGFGPLDYTLWDQHKEFYFKAIQASVAGDNQHMIRLVHDILYSGYSVSQE